MCARLEVTISFIGQKKSVINRLKSVNIAALLCLVTYRYAVFWLRTFLFVTFGRGTNMDCTKLHFSFHNYLRQLFKPHRWKCDPLEANKETQQGITCVSFWEKVSIKKKTWFGQIKENVMFWRKIQAKNFFFDEIQGEISQFLRKTSWKRCVFLPKKCIENRVTRKFDESLAKVSLKLSVAIRKFQRNFRWNFR